MPVLLLRSCWRCSAYCRRLRCWCCRACILLVCYLVLLPVLMFEEHSVFGSLMRCVQLMNTHWVQKFAVFLMRLS